jgi:hypothetical protein
MRHSSIAASVSFLLAHAVAAQVTVTPIVLSGDAVPGMPGVFFTGVGGIARLDQQGNFCFSGGWPGQFVPQSGVFSGRPGAWNLGFLFGDQSPPGPDGTWVSGIASARFVFGAGNRFAAPISVSGAGVNGFNDRAILGGELANPTRLGRTGSSAIGADAPWYYLDQRPVMNSSGNFAFLGDQTSSRDYRAIAVGGPGQDATVIAQTNGVAPGAPAGSTYTGTLLLPVISDTGAVAFGAAYREPGGTVRPAIFRYFAGSTSRVAATGVVAPPTPGVPANAVFTGMPYPSIGRAGHTAFTGSAANIPGVWTTDADGSNLLGVASANAPLQGAPATSLLSFSSPNVGPTGDLAFTGRYATGMGVTGGTDERLWKHRDGQTSLWLTEGVQAPGQPTGVRVSFSFITFTELNGSGQVAFLTQLFGPGVTSANQWALFGLDNDGSLLSIARAGDPFQVAPGDVRTIQSITLASAFSPADTNYGTGGVGGGPRALADDGTLVFTLQFTNFTSGVFTTTIPAPGAAALLVALSSLFWARRRRCEARSGSCGQ